MKMLIISRLLLALSITTISTPLFASELWVSTTGSNAECGSTLAQACGSIQAAINDATPGDTIYIAAGTYIEDSASSPYTTKCTWIDDIHASICIRNSGTEDQPITISAAPGDSGDVIIDNENARVGLHLMNSDYIAIKNLNIINNNVIGIASWGQVSNEIPDSDALSVGVVLESNIIENTHGAFGLNVSGIGMWGSQDWVVRKNIVSGVTSGEPDNQRDASCIQAYGTINALVEHNNLNGCAIGVFWKDHFVLDDERTLPFESEIRHNTVRAHNYGVNIGVRGSGTVEAGHNHVHHNVFYGFRTAGIFVNMAAANAQSGQLIVENNYFEGNPDASPTGVSVDSSTDVQIIGNIFAPLNLALEAILYSDIKKPELRAVDYNVYLVGMRVYADRYSDSQWLFGSLTEWVEGDMSLLVSTENLLHPDHNSVIDTVNSVTMASGTLAYSPQSKAIGLMPDGSNAGPLWYTGIFADSFETIGN